MRRILYKLLLGKPEYNFKLPYPAIKNQCLIIKRIWNNDAHIDVGIEKLLRLFLATIQFAFPTVYIREVLWRFGYMYQVIGVEFYVLLKIIFPYFLLTTGLYTSKVCVGFTIYLLFDSICYVGSLIFISDQHVKSRSYGRSIILLMIDYIKLTLDFSVIYAGLHLLGDKAKNVTDYIYFSFVTSATIGYGEIVPTVPLGKILVCFQSVIFLSFVVLVINIFTSRAGNELKNYDPEKLT